MAKWIIEDTTLADIADSVRERKKNTSKIAVTSISNEIKSIPFSSKVDIEYGEIVPDEDSRFLYIEHSLGKRPQFIHIWVDEEITDVSTMAEWIIYRGQTIPELANCGLSRYTSASSSDSFTYYRASLTVSQVDKGFVNCDTNSVNRKWKAGYTYKYVLICNIITEK